MPSDPDSPSHCRNDPMIHTTLNHLDHLPSITYPRAAIYLRLAPGITPDLAFAELHEGLHRTFVQIPWLNGKVYYRDPPAPDWRPNQLEIRHSPVQVDGPKPYQLKFNNLKTGKSYAELRAAGFPTTAFADEELLWLPWRANIERGCEVFVAQANFVAGGCILCISLLHSATDAMGANTILKIWADNCRLLDVEGADGAKANGVTDECSDRTLLQKVLERDGTLREPYKIDPDTWWLLGGGELAAKMELTGSKDFVRGDDAAKESMDQAPNVNNVQTSSVFYISPSKLASLKKVAVSSANNTDSSRESGQDAIYALVWRCHLRARHPPSKTPVQSGSIARFEWTIDCRSDFSASLPPSYLGNLFLFQSTSLPLSVLTSPSTSLAKVAQQIRTAKRNIYPTAMQDAYSLSSIVSDYRLLGLRSAHIQGNSLFLSSILMYPSDTVFGGRKFANGGRPDAFRPIMGGWNRAYRHCVVLPKKSSGGIELVLNLFEDEMQRLLQDEEFGQYALFVAS